MSLYLGDLDLTFGIPGENGISATHSWDGSTLTISSASGTSSMDLKGPQGDQGPKGENGYSIYHINRSLSVDPRYQEDNIYYLDSESLKSIIGTGKVFTTNDLLFSTVNGDLYKLYDTEVDGVLLSKIGNLKGPTGANGKSAYQMAVSAGYTGTESDLNKALSNATNHVLKTGDTMTGALTVNYKDGAYVTRDSNKLQLSLDGNGRATINRWSGTTHMGAMQFVGFTGGNTVGGDELRIMRADGTVYNIYGQHNSNRTQLVSTETTPTTNNEIYWTYE